MKNFVKFLISGTLLLGSLVAATSDSTDDILSDALSNSKKETILHLKTLSDEKLVHLLKSIQKNPEKNNQETWNFAGTVFNELSMRLWSKKHKKEHEAARQFIMQHSNMCLSRRAYALETAGMIDKKTKKVFHPYPFNKISKKLVKKWHKTSTDKALDDYILKYMPYREVKYLKNHSVKYLSPSQHGKYRVSFVKGQLKIGKKTPYDGTYIYALGYENNKPLLLAGIKTKGKLQHTSFFAGAPVASVGEFTIENKKVVSLKLTSGHYHPDLKHADAMITYLKHKDRLGSSKASRIKVLKYK